MKRLAIPFTFAALLAPALFALERPVTVSPGNDDSVALVEARCPTFSWGARDGGDAWRLAVYRVVDDSAASPEPGVLALSEKLPGVVRSWTPSLERCLDRGETYAWSIGSQSRRGKMAWSNPRIFRVAERSPVETDETFAAVGREPQESARVETPSEARDTAEARRQTASADRTSLGAATASAPAPRPPLAGTALDMDGHLRLATSGPRIRLDDPAQTWDIAAGAQGLFVANATSGGTQLSIFSTAPTGALELRDTGLTLKNDLICTDCIQSSDIQNDSIQSADIAPNSLGASKLREDGVGFSELAGVYGVNVECDGSCTVRPLQVCQETFTGFQTEPISVSCANPRDFDAMDPVIFVDPCGSGNDKCAASSLQDIRDDVPLSAWCSDTTGFDAVVWCLKLGSF